MFCKPSQDIFYEQNNSGEEEEEEEKKREPLSLSVSDSAVLIFNQVYRRANSFLPPLFRTFHCVIITLWDSNTESSFIILPQHWCLFWVFLTVYYVVTSKCCRHLNTYLVRYITLLCFGLSSCRRVPVSQCVFSSPYTSFPLNSVSCFLSLCVSHPLTPSLCVFPSSSLFLSLSLFFFSLLPLSFSEFQATCSTG